MTINLRSFRKNKSFVIVYLVFCLLFPYTLFAESTEYKIPKTSISYFAKNPTQQSAIAVVEPPAQIATQKTSTEPDMTIETPAVSPASSRHAIKPEEKFELSWQDKAVVEKEITKPAPAKTAPKKIVATTEKRLAKKIRPQPALIKETTTMSAAINTASDETAPAFSLVLERMQKRSAARKAEAEKLGVVLPSQGGNMSDVSPALSKLNSAIKNIINRHHCPSKGECKFCK